MVLDIQHQVPVVSIDQSQLMDQLLEWTTPYVLKGLVADWPVVVADQQGQIIDYLRQFTSQQSFNVLVGSPEIKGRFFYNHDMTGFNFSRRKASIDQVLSQLQQCQSTSQPSPSIYLGSTSVNQCLPGFLADQGLDMSRLDPLISAWLGNQTRIAAHFDSVDNLACVVGGQRRFIIFEPAALDNLYIGPTDFTPAGQAISLVDFAQPDHQRFPRFADAVAAAWVAELSAGDALFIPAMWWHHVEGLADVNLLINYWWRSTPRSLGDPMDAFRHGLLSIKSLPARQRQAWQQLFAHYIFADPPVDLSHIDLERQGELGAIDEVTARRLRTLLLQKLNR